MQTVLDRRPHFSSFFAFLPVHCTYPSETVTKWLETVYVCRERSGGHWLVERFYTKAAYHWCVDHGTVMPENDKWHWNARHEVELDDEPNITLDPKWVERGHYKHLLERVKDESTTG